VRIGGEWAIVSAPAWLNFPSTKVAKPAAATPWKKRRRLIGIIFLLIVAGTQKPLDCTKGKSTSLWEQLKCQGRHC
jgi:hypothetical protein